MFCGCPARGEQNGSNRIYDFRIFNSEIISQVIAMNIFGLGQWMLPPKPIKQKQAEFPLL
jgi:hypothetical protein